MEKFFPKPLTNCQKLLEGKSCTKNCTGKDQVTEAEPLWELLLPEGSATRLCFFSLPLSAYPFYREQVFPLVREKGLVPVTGDEIISPDENILMKIEALISRAFLVIVDAF